MKCPGQDTQYWNEEAIYEATCPQCEAMVEFYKDDTTRKCHHCGHRFVNPKMDFGCAAYCQFAEQCLGTLPEEFVAERHNLFKDKVAVEVKRYFKNDFKNIRRAAQTGNHAEELGRRTEGVDMAALLCSAYLLSVVYPHPHGSALHEVATSTQKLDTVAARDILQKLGADKTLISKTTMLLQSVFEETDAVDSTVEVIRDAHLLTELEDALKQDRVSEAEVADIRQQIVTTAGRQAADELFAAVDR